MATRWLLIVALLALAACHGCDSVNAPRPPDELPRAMYVRDAAGLLGPEGGRAHLSDLVAAGRVADVVPYGAGPLLATVEGRVTLAGWIDELHRRGGHVIVPIAGAERLAELDRLIAEHPVIWIDGLVSEYEFWNRADRAVALDELLGLLQAMRARGARWPQPIAPLRVGAYLGYPTAAEATRLAAALDFVFLDYTVAAPELAWGHVHATGGPLRDRFAWFASVGVEVWPIFYATGEVDMRAALRSRGTSAAEARFRADLAADPDYSGLAVAGFAYFTVEAMPDPD